MPTSAYIALHLHVHWTKRTGDGLRWSLTRSTWAPGSQSTHASLASGEIVADRRDGSSLDVAVALLRAALADAQYQAEHPEDDMGKV